MRRSDRRRSWIAPRVCLAAVFALVASAGAGQPETPPRPNIILVTLDTTRADRLGLYGDPRNTSPNLDRLGADSVVHDRAYSTTSWTLPAHASLFTGKFPSSHGARLDPRGSLMLSDGIQGPGEVRELRARGLSPGEQTLAGILAGQGYSTAAVVAGPWLKRIFTLDRGFAHYDDADITDVKGRLAAQVTDAALPWIEAHAKEPFFLFLNYYDPHFPYEDPEGLIREFLPPGARVWPPEETPAYADAAYIAEVRYMDEHFGRLLDRLRALGLYDDAWIIVTADHGELLGEHGAKGHGRSLYQEELRIPLIVKYPKGEQAPRRSARPVQLTDVLPLLLAELGLPLPPALARPTDETTPVFAEVRPLATIAQTGEWRAWIAGDRKLLWNSYGNHRLFDLASDPAEERDLFSEQPAPARALQADLDAFLAGLPLPAEDSVPATGTQRIDDETVRALEALGYME